MSESAAKCEEMLEWGYLVFTICLQSWYHLFMCFQSAYLILRLCLQSLRYLLFMFGYLCFLFSMLSGYLLFNLCLRPLLYLLSKLVSTVGYLLLRLHVAVAVSDGGVVSSEGMSLRWGQRLHDDEFIYEEWISDVLIWFNFGIMRILFSLIGIMSYVVVHRFILYISKSKIYFSYKNIK